MKLKIEYLNIKIPVLKLSFGKCKNKKEDPCPIADHVSVGSIIITKHGWDIGFVARVSEGKPTRILSRYHENPPSGANNAAWAEFNVNDGIQWYDTGVKISFREWKELSEKFDASEFYSYWESRLQILEEMEGE